MNLQSKIDLFYKTAIIRLSAILDKTVVSPASIGPNDRIIVSNRKEFDLSQNIIPQTLGCRNNKPRGIWYAFGTQWITFLDIQGNYAYKIEVDDSKILKLNNNNIESFIKKYKTDIGYEDCARSIGIDVDNLPINKREQLQYIFNKKAAIDWPRVAAEYSGIEIKNMFIINNKIDSKTNWDFLSSWDIDSGCIWNTSIIKSATKLGELPDFYKYDEESDYLHRGYWGKGIDAIIKLLSPNEQEGFVDGSHLSDLDRKFLSLKLYRYNVHLTHEQLKDVTFEVGSNYIALIDVPAAPSLNETIIK